MGWLDLKQLACYGWCQELSPSHMPRAIFWSGGEKCCDELQVDSGQPSELAKSFHLQFRQFRQQRPGRAGHRSGHEVL